MRRSITAPRVIRRIAVQRLFRSSTGKPVVLTIGVPQPILRGADWACAIQITGIDSSLRRPRFVFGIDGLQSLELAIKCAAAELESKGLALTWLGEPGDLGLPIFLPHLPPRQQKRLAAKVEREAVRFWKQAAKRRRGKI